MAETPGAGGRAGIPAQTPTRGDRVRYLTDLCEADVALALGIAPATVRAHVHRALVHLRGQLGADFQENDLAIE